MKVIWHSDVLRCNAVLLGDRFPIFRWIIVPSSSKDKQHCCDNLKSRKKAISPINSSKRHVQALNM